MRRALALSKEKLATAISAAKDIVRKPGAVFPGSPVQLELKTVNIALSVVLLILVMGAVYYAAAGRPKISRMISAARIQGPLSSISTEITTLKPTEFYTDDAHRRNIFSPSQRVAEEPRAPAREEKGTPDGELNLRGIAWSDVPKALIQAGKENKLYILKEGQAVGTTGIKVKKILRNKVVMVQGEREFEL